MVNQDAFRRQVRDALHHLYDYPYLENHPLAAQFWPEVRPQGTRHAHRLSRLLLECIEELSPPGTAADASRARFYALLVARYVDERPLREIMRELGYSRSQFFREQQRAISLLASILRERLPQATVSPPRANLLDAEADRLLVQREAVDPVEIVEGVLGIVRHLAEQEGVALLYDLAPHLPALYGCRTLLRQALLKALSSLISRPGTRQVRIRMRHEGPGLAIELIAAPGLSDGADAASGPEWQLVRRLVEMMGGDWQGIRRSPDEIACAFHLPAGTSKLLLVIDDNEGIIYAFQGYLAGYGYAVVGTRTGTEALRLARQLAPSAITLDIMMPAQDGWEILQALKDDPATRSIPVIICSVLEDPQLARSLGAAAYLQKPVSQADLLDVLERLCVPV